MMNVKEIREKTGLTQKDFAELYRIPTQTLKQWESAPGTTSHREPPEYVVHMLVRMVRKDFGVNLGSLDRAESLILSAQLSRDCGRLWLRYLRKEFEGDSLRLSNGDIEKVLHSSELTPLQKVMFKRAVTPGTATNEHVRALNKPADTTAVDQMIKQLKERKKEKK